MHRVPHSLGNLPAERHPVYLRAEHARSRRMRARLRWASLRYPLPRRCDRRRLLHRPHRRYGLRLLGDVYDTVRNARPHAEWSDRHLLSNTCRSGATVYDALALLQRGLSVLSRDRSALPRSALQLQPADGDVRAGVADASNADRVSATRCDADPAMCERTVWWRLCQLSILSPGPELQRTRVFGGNLPSGLGELRLRYGNRHTKSFTDARRHTNGALLRTAVRWHLCTVSALYSGHDLPRTCLSVGKL
jgi:hypothetical protein